MRGLNRKIKHKLSSSSFDSSKYWEERYSSGGNSGDGSYGKLADFKSKILNNFVAKQGINKVVEFGCGDGNQLSIARYPSYIGLDVSTTIVKKCADKFHDDYTKSFFLYNHNAFVDRSGVFKCDLALSLDVLYHLIEDDIYQNYIRHLFNSSEKFVIIYAANEEIESGTAHEKYRKFTADVEAIAKGWELAEVIENEHKVDQGGSLANFYIYKKTGTL
jgi:hypothetical protein